MSTRSCNAVVTTFHRALYNEGRTGPLGLCLLARMQSRACMRSRELSGCCSRLPRMVIQTPFQIGLPFCLVCPSHTPPIQCIASTMDCMLRSICLGFQLHSRICPAEVAWFISGAAVQSTTKA
eukprot:3946342-Pleurochrysis_carterae.AAC.2